MRFSISAVSWCADFAFAQASRSPPTEAVLATSSSAISASGATRSASVIADVWSADSCPEDEHARVEPPGRVRHLRGQVEQRGVRIDDMQSWHQNLRIADAV